MTARCECFTSDWCDLHERVSFWPDRFRAWRLEAELARLAETPEARERRHRELLAAALAFRPIIAGA